MVPHHAGISNIAGYCLYINRIARTTFAPSVGPGVLRYTAQHSTLCQYISPQVKLGFSFMCPDPRYNIGPPLFLGLVGCFLIFLGAVFYAVTVCYVLRRERYMISPTPALSFYN